jgi:hypothetical protein
MTGVSRETLPLSTVKDRPVPNLHAHSRFRLVRYRLTPQQHVRPYRRANATVFRPRCSQLLMRIVAITGKLNEA